MKKQCRSKKEEMKKKKLEMKYNL